VPVKPSPLAQETTALAIEYGELAARKQPSEEELDRIEDILTLAMHNEQLNFLIDEIDHCLGHRLGLLEPEAQAHYEDQQSVLREYLEALPDSYPNQKINPEHLKILPQGQHPTPISETSNSTGVEKHTPSSCQKSTNCH
jgi:hypothetical protein